jgi:hypothetical protein
MYQWKIKPNGKYLSFHSIYLKPNKGYLILIIIFTVLSVEM